MLAAMARRTGDFYGSEDAMQEALLAAANQWPREGVPDSPRGWLTTVASRRWAEQQRGEAARRRREQTVAAGMPPGSDTVPGSETVVAEDMSSHEENEQDDTLTLLLLCCHPELSRPSQVALTLRAVGGLTTREIARAFLTAESTIGQRISRAKQRIWATGAEFGPPPAQQERVEAVLSVLYLIFNEGYTASEGHALYREDLSGEAIRLTRMLRTRLPTDGEVAGLLALMLLTEARRPARTDADGALIPLEEQDRSRWDRAAIAEGIALVRDTLRESAGRVGPYQVQAAIAALHDEAERAEDTDWPQILKLYDVLLECAPGPIVRLARIVAVAMVHGPRAGLALLAELDAELAGHHRLHAVRAHLLERDGRTEDARVEYERAAELTASEPERAYLSRCARRLGDGGASSAGR